MRPRGKIGIGIGQMPAYRGRIVGRQHPGAMHLEHGIGYSCGLGRSTERPAEMLPRMAAADGAAVVREHLVVKAIDDRELDGERRCAFGPAGGKVAADLPRQPRTALGGTPDHHRVGTGGRKRGHSIRASADVAVHRDRN